VKYLTLIRHAKASAHKGPHGDMGRTINERGRKDASVLGAALGGVVPPPGMILSGPAVRVRETLEVLVEAASTRAGRSFPLPEEHDELYLAEADTIWDLCYSAFMEYDDVWLCGHNPGISEAVSLLAGIHIGSVPTLAVARIAFEEVLPTTAVGELVFYDTPRNHR
jgi:phosphohistidine phosphatase